MKIHRQKEVSWNRCLHRWENAYIGNASSPTEHPGGTCIGLFPEENSQARTQTNKRKLHACRTFTDGTSPSIYVPNNLARKFRACRTYTGNTYPWVRWQQIWCKNFVPVGFVDGIRPLIKASIIEPRNFCHIYLLDHWYMIRWEYWKPVLTVIV